ncbi:MAG: PA2169 family four-helix-bundle protein [Cryomorphaceae bacterium]|nr:PA2169 family four-helix-bundle protein [Flavobacteriales bacterium]
MQKELNLLLSRNLDGERGYTNASTHIKNENFKNFLKAYADQRRKYAQEIKDRMEELGIEPREDFSTLGSIHHAIMELITKISSNADKALMEECARGESMAVSDYKKAMKSNMFDSDTLSMVMKQHDKIMAAKQTLKKIGEVI